MIFFVRKSLTMTNNFSKHYTEYMSNDLYILQKVEKGKMELENLAI